MPTISVVTASYNYEKYIKETIESVINQTFSDWEMIIVDDGSKDNSVDVIKSYCDKDSRIKLFQHSNGENKGLIETLKLGIEKAEGKWIVFLESDDTIEPDYMAEKLKIADENNNVKFIYNDVNLFGEEQAVQEMYNENFTKLYKILDNIKSKKDYLNWFKKRNLVTTFSVVMIETKLMKSLNFDSKITQWIDYYLWSQVVGQYDFYYLPEKLTNWRIHKTSYNNKKTNPYDGVYFMDIQIRDNLSGGRNKLFHRIRAIPKYLRAFKREFIKIHPKENQIIILGKTFSWGK